MSYHSAEIADLVMKANKSSEVTCASHKMRSAKGPLSKRKSHLWILIYREDSQVSNPVPPSDSRRGPSRNSV
jgi:hypothetical protein